jgi:hypothetical protein
MRKVISTICENKVQLPVKVPNLRDEHEKHIIITAYDDEDSLYRLLGYINDLANIGHSFTIRVDPGNPDYEKNFYIDGDGSDRIVNITKHTYDDSVTEYKQQRIR